MPPEKNSTPQYKKPASQNQMGLSGQGQPGRKAVTLKHQLSHKSLPVSRRSMPGRKLVALEANGVTSDNESVASVVESYSPDQVESEARELLPSRLVLPGIARSLSSLKSATPDLAPLIEPQLLVRTSTPLPRPISQAHRGVVGSTGTAWPPWYAGDLTVDVEARQVGVTVYLANPQDVMFSEEDFTIFANHCYARHAAEVSIAVPPQSLEEHARQSLVMIYVLWVNDNMDSNFAIKEAEAACRSSSPDKTVYLTLALKSSLSNSAVEQILNSVKTLLPSMSIFGTEPSQLVTDLSQHLCKLVDEKMSSQPPNSPWKPVLECVHNNMAWCRQVSDRGARLWPREFDLISAKLNADLSITASEHSPIVVIGPVGSGKTWLLGQTATDFASACQRKGAPCITVVRFCALSSTVNTYPRLLESLTRQICDILPAVSASGLDSGGGIGVLFSSFCRLLVAASASSSYRSAAHLLLVLDGLDYLLDSEFTAAFMSSVAVLPPGVSLLVSTKTPDLESDLAWVETFRGHGTLVELSEELPESDAATYIAQQLSVAADSTEVSSLVNVTKQPVYLAAVLVAAKAGVSSFCEKINGKTKWDALALAMAIAGGQEDRTYETAIFCVAQELSNYETAISDAKKMKHAESEGSPPLYQAMLKTTTFRMHVADLLFNVVVGGVRASIWQHSSFGLDWSLRSLDAEAWLKHNAELLRRTLLGLYKDPSIAGLGWQLAASTPSNLEATAGGATSSPNARLMFVLPYLLSKYCASVFDFQSLVLFFNKTEPESDAMKDLVFSVYCGYRFLAAKLKFAGTRAVIHDIEDFLAVWEFKFKSSRSNVERTGLAGLEEMYAFFVTHENFLDADPTAFSGLFVGTIGIDISMEHERAADLYKSALSDVNDRRALHPSMACLRLDYKHFDSRYISNNVKNMKQRREKKYYASALVENNELHLSHNYREIVRVWKETGMLMFEKEFEGRVVYCTALSGDAKCFAVATTQINIERELTLAIHCVGDCYWYRVANLGARDIVNTWMSSDARIMVICEKISANAMKVALCHPKPVSLTSETQIHEDATDEIQLNISDMTFMSRYLELPQKVEAALYDEMKQHAEREGAGEREELKFYKKTPDERYYILDVAGLEADVDSLHGMQYLWNEMREQLDAAYFSLPVNELFSNEVTLPDAISKHKVAVLGLIDSTLIILHTVSNDSGRNMLYVMHAMADRLEIQKQLSLDSLTAMTLTPSGLLLYADSSSPRLTSWNVAANEKDVLDGGPYHGSEPITCLKYIEKSSFVYTFSKNSAVVWDVKSCTLVHATLWRLTSKVLAAAVHAQWVAIGTADGELSIYAEWKQVSNFKLQGPVSSIYLTWSKEESAVRLSCIHGEDDATSIAFLTMPAPSAEC